MGKEIYIIPLTYIIESLQPDAKDIRTVGGSGVTIQVRGEYLPVISAAKVFDVGGDVAKLEQSIMVIVEAEGQRMALSVDDLVGQHQVVIKSLETNYRRVHGISGATIMGDGSVVMILDMAPLVRKVAALRQTTIDEQGEEVPYMPVQVPIVAERRQPLVMVVDDSITMRKVTSRVLERNDIEVTTAKDGLDAVEKIQDRIPDLVLLDIEMPRMDGYEFATYMRNDPRLKAVPIIMITSRTGEKHRQRAMEIGVDRYLGKPYQEADLLRNVDEILRLTRAVH